MGGGAPKAETAQQNQSWENLNKIFGSATTAGAQQGSQGTSSLDAVTKYFQSLLSGDRTATAQAVAPAANAAIAQADVAKKQQASFGTNRTGGTVAGNQTIDDATRAQIDALIGGAGPAAAGQLAGIGQGQVQNMLSALGIGTSATGTVGAQTSADINSRREAAARMWSAIISGGAKVASAGIA